MRNVRAPNKTKRTKPTVPEIQPVARKRGSGERPRPLLNRPPFEQLLATLSTAFTNLPADEVDGALEEGLKQVVEWFAVDRSTFGEIARDEASARFIQCYAVPGAPRFPPQSVLRQFSWYFDQLRSGHIIRLSTSEELPNEAREEREYALRSGFHANLAIPIFSGKSLIFMIAIGCFKRKRVWPAREVRQLRLIGEIFSNAVARQRMEETSRNGEKRRQIFLETTMAIPWEFDMETHRFTYVGPQSIDLFGYSLERWFQPGFLEAHLFPADRDAVMEKLRAFSKKFDRYELVYRMTDAHGGVRWLHNLVTVHRQGGRPTILIGFMMDITSSKRAEEQLRDLSGRLISAQEDERRRIARDLHDDINQGLALVSTELERLSAEIGTSAPKPANKIRQTIRQINDLGTSVHTLSTTLYSTKLEHLGLSAALRALCRDLSRQNDLMVHFCETGHPNLCPADVALCLYRVAQESLQNVRKHSGATEARVTLRWKPDWVELIIEDEGTGFDHNGITAKGSLGLVSMRERLRLVGGEFTIQSSPAGTKVHVVVHGDDRNSGEKKSLAQTQPQ